MLSQTKLEAKIIKSTFMQQKGTRNALAATAPIEGQVGASPELNGGYGAIILATVVDRLMPDVVGVHFEWLSATLCSHSSHEWFNGGFKVERPSGAAGHGQVIRGLDPLVVDVEEPRLAVVPEGTRG